MNFVSVWQKKVNSIVPFLLAVIFLASGFYELPFVNFDVSGVLKVKNTFYMILMGAMLLSLSWRAVSLDAFGAGCLIWAGACVVSFLVSEPVSSELYLKRLAQVSFLWVFVTYVRQHQGLVSYYCEKYFSSWLVFFGGLALIILSFNMEVAAKISNGFGNNRVNFSIWLSQLVFLLFLSKTLISPNSEIKSSLFFHALPMLGFQMFLGSRTGLLASVLVYFFALLFLKRHKVGIALLLVATLFLAWHVSPLRVDPSMDITRALSMDVKDTHAWVDRFSSYRLGIAETAVASLTPIDLLLGKGMGNFQGYAIGQSWDVHNIYLKAIGELGLGGFFSLLLIVVQPLRNTLLSTTRMRLAFFYFLLDLGVGLVHPEFLVTALSTCLVFWMVYAYLIESEQNAKMVASA